MKFSLMEKSLMENFIFCAVKNINHLIWYLIILNKRKHVW